VPLSDASARRFVGSILTPLEQAEIVATGRVVEVENAPGIQTARFAIEKQLAGEAVGQNTIWIVSPRSESGNPLPNDLSLEKGERVLLLLLPVSGEGAPGLPESAEVYTLVPRAGQAKIEAGEGSASESVALVAGYLAVREASEPDQKKELRAFLKSQLGIRDPALRAGVLTDLGPLLGKGDDVFLVETATDRGLHPEVRSWALRRLRVLNPGADPPELRRLLTQEPDPDVKRALQRFYAHR